MTLSVHSPDELIAVIPHLLGFKPDESIVFLPMRSDLPVARVDRPTTARDRDFVWNSISDAFDRYAQPSTSVCITADRTLAESASISRSFASQMHPLIGDDRQLAAIGAGGVLRDITATHGAVRLDELVRFADRAEAEASLALREGDQSSLGFYLDNDRVHVGDADCSVDEVVEAWQRERAGGRDCLILAPTRELIRELNLRAQAGCGPAGASGLRT